MKQVHFHSEATAELDEAAAYYERQRRGLGAALLDEVERVVLLIRESPDIGAPYKDTGFRYYVTRRFPYVVFYLNLPDAIWVAGVAHGKRRPGYWMRRRTEV